MNEVYKLFAVIEGFQLTDGEVRIHSLIYIVQGTVSDIADLLGAGNRKYSSESCRTGTDNTGTAAACTADQRNVGSSLESGRNQIPAGE